MTTKIIYKHRQTTPTIKEQPLTAIFDWLNDNFPKLFQQSSAPKQLKIGILSDIIAQKKDSQPSRERLKRALQHYTSHPDYLAQQITGTSRFDLEGRIAGKVTALQATHALKRLNQSSNQPPKKSTHDKPKATDAVETDQTTQV